MLWGINVMSTITLNLPLNTYDLLRRYLTGRKFVIGEENFWRDTQIKEDDVPQNSILES